MTAKSLFLSLLFSAAMIVPAFAEEAPKEEASPAQTAAPAKTPAKSVVAKSDDSIVSTKKKEVTPITVWIDAENAMIDPLSNADKESIFILRGKHSIIRTIGVVERDVGNAVKACGKANPDMKATMEDRFKQWKDAVDPIVDTAQKNLKGEIEKQNIVNADQFRKVLKLNDEAFDYGDKRTVKNPVSSPEACKLLLDSMDSTEDQMVSLLQETLLPPSVIKSRADKVRQERSDKKSFGKDAVKPQE